MYCAGHKLNLIEQDIFNDDHERASAVSVLQIVMKFVLSSKRFDSFDNFNVCDVHDYSKICKAAMPHLMGAEICCSGCILTRVHQFAQLHRKFFSRFNF